MIPIEKAIKYRNYVWVFPEKQEGLSSLQDIITQSESQNFSELQIQTILRSLLEVLGKFVGQIKHLDPNAVFLNQDFTKAKVICGDKRVFDFLSVGSDLRFGTPEVLSNPNWIPPLGLVNDDSQASKIFSDAQIYWDLGIILYELATGGLKTFFHSNQRVLQKLIIKYPVTFAIN